MYIYIYIYIHIYMQTCNHVVFFLMVINDVNCLLNLIEHNFSIKNATFAGLGRDCCPVVNLFDTVPESFR